MLLHHWQSCMRVRNFLLDNERLFIWSIFTSSNMWNSVEFIKCGKKNSSTMDYASHNYWIPGLSKLVLEMAEEICQECVFFAPQVLLGPLKLRLIGYN